MLASYILTPNTGTLRRVRAIDASKNDDHIQQRELAVQYDRENIFDCSLMRQKRFLVHLALIEGFWEMAHRE